jgi:phosphate transport system protein
MAATGTGGFRPLAENVPRPFPNRPPRRRWQVVAEGTMTRTNGHVPPAPSAFSAQGALVLTTFEQRLEGLEAKLLQMGQLVQSQLDRTLEALSSHDTVLANEVIVRDDAIDTAYREVEEEILRTLALQAPVAKDLRLVAGVLHINSHIERMGDLCVNMAKFVRIVKDYPPVPEIQTTLLEMGSLAQKMVAAAMTCFARRDVELAERLPILDQPLDRLNSQIFLQIERAAEDDSTLEWASRMILVSRYLERLGDHSVDIGEQVVFIVTGEVRELVPSKAARAGVED